MGERNHVLAAMRRDAYQDVGGEGEKQRSCKQGHEEVHLDSILGCEIFTRMCIQMEYWKTDGLSGYRIPLLTMRLDIQQGIDL